jgi:hypothetical protein
LYLPYPIYSSSQLWSRNWTSPWSDQPWNPSLVSRKTEPDSKLWNIFSYWAAGYVTSVLWTLSMILTKFCRVVLLCSFRDDLITAHWAQEPCWVLHGMCYQDWNWGLSDPQTCIKTPCHLAVLSIGPPKKSQYLLPMFNSFDQQLHTNISFLLAP